MEALSDREMQVADLIHLGYIDKEIADELCISTETVRTHRKNINRKLHARNSADVTRIFITHLKEHWVAILGILLLLAIMHRNPEILQYVQTSIIKYINH